MSKVLDLDYKPKLPNNKKRGIGIIGAGEIVREAHLPAYRIAGFHVVGITDVVHERAQKVANRYDISKVYESVDALLEDPEVEIVDVAVPAKFQLDIVRKVADAKKHVLCQKPLGDTYEAAEQIAGICEGAGIKAAVNQQMRWSPGIRASHNMIQKGWMGQLLQVTIQVNVNTIFSNWEFLRTIDTLEVMYHSIHYLDSIRSLFGTPESIFADGTRYPGQQCKGETRTMIHMEFPGETRALVHDNHNNWATEDDWFATFRFEGTDGIIKGTNGALYNYPIGREDTISILSKKLDESTWFSPVLEGKWFPHAFIGTMGELMLAIEEEREPENSVKDNLKTLQMVFGAYLSMKEKRLVNLNEIGS